MSGHSKWEPLRHEFGAEGTRNFVYGYKLALEDILDDFRRERHVNNGDVNRILEAVERSLARTMESTVKTLEVMNAQAEDRVRRDRGSEDDDL